MPLFSSFRRFREPELEHLEQSSTQPVQESSSSSLPTQSEVSLPQEQTTRPESTAEVTLTWNTDVLNEGQQIIVSTGSGQENVVTLDDPVDEPPSPIEPPPNYEVARISSYPVTYTFSSLGGSSSAMILVPTQDSPDTRPVYHISIGNDPFLPMCFITSVVRGGNGEGEYVGGFKTIQTYQMYPSNRDIPRPESETVTIRGSEHTMPTIFSKCKRLKVRNFDWGFKFKTSFRLTWSCPGFPLTRVYTCYKHNDITEPLARFTPADELLQRNKPFPEAKLEIMPIGHVRFDDILISALLLERNRRVTYNTGLY